jgi:2-polyprenyl-3-methyl-5-hydroxy-6-metoxy-1,4-benzoquinol methylase
LYLKNELFSCGVCGGFSYLGAMNADVADLYSDGYFNEGEYLSYSADESVHNLNFTRKMQILRRYARHPIRLFEVGCAYGFFLDVVRKSGCENFFGIDVNPSVVAKAGQRVGVDHVGLVSQVKQPAPNTNVVVAWDVWEHLEHPFDVFRSYTSSLPQGALLALSTVDSGALVAKIRGPKWRQIHPPTHLHYPNRKSLSMAFEKMGFEVVYHKAFGYYRSLETYARALGMNGLIPEAFKKTPVYLDLFDTQLILGRKLR